MTALMTLYDASLLLCNRKKLQLPQNNLTTLKMYIMNEVFAKAVVIRFPCPKCVTINQRNVIGKLATSLIQIGPPIQMGCLCKRYKTNYSIMVQNLPNLPILFLK